MDATGHNYHEPFVALDTTTMNPSWLRLGLAALLPPRGGLGCCAEASMHLRLQLGFGLGLGLGSGLGLGLGFENALTNGG